jgi:hypothetical protein
MNAWVVMGVCRLNSKIISKASFMNIENFAEWQRHQGRQVVRTESSYWYEAGPRVFQAFPYHHLIKPSEWELRRLMLEHGILALRYSAPLDTAIGKVSYHVVQCSPYNLETTGKKARYSVRQGLSCCQVEQISFMRLAGEGWRLQQDTLERQGRTSSMKETAWRRICLSAEGLPGFEAWGALVHGELAAALLTSRIDDTCYVLYSLSLSKFLGLCVNNAVFYSATHNLLTREGVNQIFFTVQSLDAPGSVDEFKFRMGFKAKAVRQRVVFHPLLQPLINNYAHKLVCRLFQRYPEQGFLAKSEGMIRFYLQGKLPLDQQDWPDCLAQSTSKSPEYSTPGTITQANISSSTEFSKIE